MEFHLYDTRHYLFAPSAENCPFLWTLFTFIALQGRHFLRSSTMRFNITGMVHLRMIQLRYPTSGMGLLRSNLFRNALVGPREPIRIQESKRPEEVLPELWTKMTKTEMQHAVDHAKLDYLKRDAARPKRKLFLLRWSVRRNTKTVSRARYC